MPKDRAEVQDQYKIGGGSLNEFEFDQSKGEMEEQEHARPGGEHGEGLLRGAAEPNAPQNVAGRTRRVEEAAHEKVERLRAKRGEGRKGAAAGSKRGAKKGAAKKGAGKGGAGKAAKGGAGKKTTKGGAQKSTKGGSKRGAAKKGSGARK